MKCQVCENPTIVYSTLIQSRIDLDKVSIAIVFLMKEENKLISLINLCILKENHYPFSNELSVNYTHN